MLLNVNKLYKTELKFLNKKKFFFVLINNIFNKNFYYKWIDNKIYELPKNKVEVKFFINNNVLYFVEI